MKIGIYGGTFDPPHLGHMMAARTALDSLGLDRLILVPNNLPPHKDMSAMSAPPRRRYEMACLMADGMGRGKQVSVSRIEIDREGRCYTADTLKELREEYPEDELTLLMGSDMFLTLQTWQRPEEIFAQAEVVGFGRSLTERPEVLEMQAEFLRKTYGARARVLPLEINDVSSTRLRLQLSTGNDEAAAQLWPPVYGYILRHRLYGSRKNMRDLSREELRLVVSGMVRHRRAAHIRGTEETAVRLARRWGADEEEAACAAILHDCTKYESGESQRALCARFYIALDDLEQQTEKLLHAKTAAALAREEFGMSEAVAAAIQSHTTGQPDMTPLQKILYVADYIEPTRDFSGVEELRKLADEDLDRAMIACLELSVREIAEKGAKLHPNTADGLAFLKERVHA